MRADSRAEATAGFKGTYLPLFQVLPLDTGGLVTYTKSKPLQISQLRSCLAFVYLESPAFILIHINQLWGISRFVNVSFQNGPSHQRAQYESCSQE